MRLHDFFPIPAAPDWQIDWPRLKSTVFAPWFEKMSRTPQDADWHGEGDVWTHTQMVCEELVGLDAWRELAPERREIVFVAALLHDVGKAVCTTIEPDGRIVSHGHSRRGVEIVRDVFWRDLGLSGSPEAQRLREAVCSLIHFHSVPQHVLDAENPTELVVRSASDGVLVPIFTNRLLSILSEADLRGRVASDVGRKVDLVQLFREEAEENACLDAPFPFASAFSRFAWFQGRTARPEIELFDDSWGEVVLLAGLPGTGKDFYAAEKLAGLPMISLDDLRVKMKIDPEDDQAPVIFAAKEQAKAFLRAHEPFVWNATNLSQTIRGPLVQLFSNYGASVRICFLETEWNEMLRRNQSRDRVVPQSAYNRLMRNFEPPSIREAHQVEWLCR